MMKKRTKFTLIYLFLIFSINTQGQIFSDSFLGTDWNKVTLNAKLSAQFNLQKYKTIIIANITDQRGRQSKESRNIYDILTAKLNETPNIKLLDRENIKMILNTEYKLQESGYIDQDYIIKMRNFYGSGIILVGRVINSDYQTNLNSESNLFSKQKLRYRTATQRISLSIKVIDIETTEIVYSTTLDVEGTDKTKKSTDTPRRIDESLVYQRALNSLGDNFKNIFNNHQKKYTIEFQKNSKFNKLLKEAVALINVSSYDEAYILLKEVLELKKVIKNDRALSSAYYNIALFELITNRIELAKKNAKKGYLKNSKNDECLKLFKKLNKTM